MRVVGSILGRINLNAAKFQCTNITLVSLIQSLERCIHHHIVGSGNSTYRFPNYKCAMSLGPLCRIQFSDAHSLRWDYSLRRISCWILARDFSNVVFHLPTTHAFLFITKGVSSIASNCLSQSNYKMTQLQSEKHLAWVKVLLP